MVIAPKAGEAPVKLIDVWANQTQIRAFLSGLDSPRFRSTAELEKLRYGASPKIIGSEKLSQKVTAVHNSSQHRNFKLVPQGRDQEAKLPFLVRKETQKFGRSHQSPVRILTSTVNGALSSSRSIKMPESILPCGRPCHSIQRLVQ